MTTPARTSLPLEAQRILEERAKALARPHEEAGTTAPALELLTFSHAGSVYAVAASDVIAVVPLGDPTPVPGTPPAIRGVVNHRGRILAVVDVGHLVAAAERDTAETDLGIVVAVDDASFILVSELAPELVSLNETDVTPADRPESFIRGVTATMAAVLDMAALAHDPRIAIDDESE